MIETSVVENGISAIKEPPVAGGNTFAISVHEAKSDKTLKLDVDASTQISAVYRGFSNFMGLKPEQDLLIRRSGNVLNPIEDKCIKDYAIEAGERLDAVVLRKKRV